MGRWPTWRGLMGEAQGGLAPRGLPGIDMAVSGAVAIAFLVWLESFASLS